ncbi:MAG: riboflavin kinase / adenylyltransferase [Verrucomicrobiota bacterium]|jgi:riboflavin kinase/FMN adenylyltransferase
MKLLKHPRDLGAAGRKVCLAIGMFDGVHLGHQHVIRQTVTDAGQQEGLAVVVSFDRHPNSVVAPSRLPPLIYSLPQKVRAIESLGVEATWLIHFDLEFSRQEAGAFVQQLVAEFQNVHSICVGSDFAFGKQRAGNVELLRRLGGEFRFVVHGLAAVSLDGRAVSSTRIREAIMAGRLEMASEMLGRAYSLAGPVMEGARLGTQLGFPTANLDTTGLALPPNGVYAAHASIGSRRHRAAVNIGLRPTIAGGAPAPRVEAHLLDWKGDIYGQELELTFVQRLRDERRFDSVDALREQIQLDVAATRNCFDN